MLPPPPITSRTTPPRLPLPGGDQSGAVVAGCEWVEVQITGGSCRVDTEDLALVNGYRWHITSRGYVCNTIRVSPTRQTQLPMHRLILPAPLGVDVHHKNHDRTDNRRGNLEQTTRSRHHYKRRSKPGHLKGTGFDRGRWYARLGMDGKQKHLGRFDTAEEAREAYCRAFRKYIGEEPTA